MLFEKITTNTSTVQELHLKHLTLNMVLFMVIFFPFGQKKKKKKEIRWKGTKYTQSLWRHRKKLMWKLLDFQKPSKSNKTNGQQFASNYSPAFLSLKMTIFDKTPTDLCNKECLALDDVSTWEMQSDEVSASLTEVPLT